MKMEIVISVPMEKDSPCSTASAWTNHLLEVPPFVSACRGTPEDLSEMLNFQITEVWLNQSFCSAFPSTSLGTSNPWDTPLLWNQCKMLKYQKAQGTNCSGTNTVRSSKMFNFNTHLNQHFGDLWQHLIFLFFTDLKYFIFNQDMPKPKQNYINVVLSWNKMSCLNSPERSPAFTRKASFFSNHFYLVIASPSH